ncbi:MAG: hypothetical protein H0V36_03805 [Chloroflexi bacterium]|nr:hypothetical protein [Chloroflexota bacterium]
MPRGGPLIGAISAAGALLCAIVAFGLLVRIGPRYRIARLLAAAPQVTLAEAIALARSGSAHYVKAVGRVSSKEEFPDENERPLVFRRRRIEAADTRSRWRLVDEVRHAVPFGLEDRSHFVAVDSDALGDGLVVIPRESVGLARDLPAEPRGLLGDHDGDDVVVRMRLDQVSAVEHATVAGLIVQDGAGACFTSGLGRPLILSTVASDAAMRLLAGDRRRSVRVATILLCAASALAVTATVATLAGR